MRHSLLQLLLPAALLIAGPLPAQTPAVPGPPGPAPRSTVDWDAGWLFSKSDSAMAMTPAFNDTGWRAIRVPHDWSVEEPFSPDYGSGNGYAAGGVGWYRKHFTLDPAQRDRLVTVEFDGIYDHAEVWINGQFAGGRPYGYSSFHLDLTRHLKFDGENILAVRVDHSRYADSRFYTGSGIYRHVRLCLTDRLHLGQWGTFVSTPKVADDAALVRVETTLVNDAAEPREYALQSEVIAADGRVVASRTANGRLASGESQPVVQELDVPQPQRWSLEAPVLYTLRNRVSVAGTAADETTTPFGIRTLVFDPDKGFLLNGRAVKLKGVCIHHDAGSLGAAVPDQVLERRLRLLRGLGVNAIRTSHNPPAPELLDLCDRLGLLVKDEGFDEFTPPKKKWVQGWNVGEPGKYGYGEVFAEWSVRDMEDLVRRDRNHPSVILWSIGNEIDYANDPFSHPVLGNAYRPQNPPASDLVRLGAPLIAAVRRLDPTRPVTAALANVEMSDAVGFGELFEVVGYNYQELRYPADHLKYPKRVIFGSENRHDYNAWAVVRDHDYISGQFLWTGIDYLGEAGRWPSRGSGSGLLDLCGFKKPLAWFRQSLWSEQPMVYLSAAVQAGPVATPAGATQGVPALDRARRSRTEEHWNWPAGSTLTVTCYSNCPEIQLTLNGRPVGTKRLTDAVEGVLTWTVPYEPGLLKAVGLREGKPVCEFALQTAGPASRVELLPDKTRLTTDGNSVCHLEYRIVDASGVRVPDAAQTVTFEVAGPAVIIGIGNGDLGNTEDPRGRVHQAYQGRGLAILQSTGASGEVTVKASVPGLEPAAVILSAELAGPAAAPPNSPAVLPGRGLAQHPFFYAGEWNYPHPEQTLFIVRDGRVVWSYAIPLKSATGEIQEYSDATLLSNGNVIFARKTGAALVTPDKKVLWNYDAPKGFEVHVAQPLGLDRVMLIQNGNPAKMMIVNLTSGQTEKEMVLPTGNPAKTHGQFRRARLTAAGTLLAAHMDNNKVAEYDVDGKEIWSLAVPSPWAAVRLKNGNTLLTSNKGFVREVNPRGETVWELTQKDVPEIKFFSLQEANRLANGNTVISNWCPNGIKNPKDWPTSVQVIEVTPEKKIVWALRAWDEPASLGPATCIQLLDEPGIPENGEQQR